MLDGKAYYRAVRGHMLAYNALFRILWKNVLAWLHSNNRKLHLDMEVEKLVTAFNGEGSGSPNQLEEFVFELTNTMKLENTQELFAEFKHQFEVYPNFLLLCSYMDMMETLLDFIRANREGNWRRQLDAFTAVFP